MRGHGSGEDGAKAFLSYLKLSGFRCALVCLPCKFLAMGKDKSYGSCTLQGLNHRMTKSVETGVALHVLLGLSNTDIYFNVHERQQRECSQITKIERDHSGVVGAL